MNKKANSQIIANNLGVTYFQGQSNEIKSLSDLSFVIEEGEFIIFFGPSGCGKSTLLYSIASLERWHGDLTVDGVNLSAMTAQEKELYHREHIGMIFQSFYLISTLSVLQNVALPLVLAGVPRKEREKRAMLLLERFGVKDQANKLPSALSGGQQQRVAICRAVINDPKIILADEPLGNLDSKSAAEVIELFKELNGRFGKTLILVTHDPTYLDLANRVFFIKDGALVNIKVNRPLGAKQAVSDSGVGRETLDFIDKHFSKLTTTETPSLLRAHQAKNIATLSLFGLTLEEFDRIRDSIERSLTTEDNFDNIFNLLDKSSAEGGLDFDKRKAKAITEKIRSLAAELKLSEKLPDAKGHELSLARQMRVQIFAELELDSVKLSAKELKIIDDAILGRINGDLDSKALFLALDEPWPEGAGLDKRVATKIAKRLELWLIEHKG